MDMDMRLAGCDGARRCVSAVSVGPKETSSLVCLTSSRVCWTQSRLCVGPEEASGLVCYL